MAYVIAEPCIDTKDNSCVEVCPVDCIHPTPEEPDYDRSTQLYIDPEECIDCDACVEACPVDACFAEDQLPDEWQNYIQINVDYYKQAASPLHGLARGLGRHRQSGARHLRHGRARRGLEHRELLGRGRDHAARGVEERLDGRRIRILEHERASLVGADAELLLERDLAEQRHVELVGEQLAAALAEDREALAAWA